jgi:hypothetical protein
VDLEKKISIEGWTIPKNVLEIRYFVGLAWYYRRFIEGFSRIAHPITSFQKKGVRFEWTSYCEMIFQHLKYLLTSVPILRIVNTNEEFIMCTNA